LNIKADTKLENERVYLNIKADTKLENERV